MGQRALCGSRRTRLLLTRRSYVLCFRTRDSSNAGVTGRLFNVNAMVGLSSTGVLFYCTLKLCFGKTTLVRILP